ncbi:MAG: hypothetical protein HWE22_03970 [Flavobacteriales bacterium]|nr:hypothetical protein [Flavobacteriales bacterium]
MKNVLHILFLVAAMIGGNFTTAQTAETHVNNIIDLTDDIDGNARDTYSAAYTLYYEYFTLSSPNLAGFNAQIYNMQTNGIQVHAEDLIYSAQQAAILDPSLDVSAIVSYANEVQSLVDDITDEAQDLQGYVQNQNDQAIQNSIQIIYQATNEQVDLAEQILEEAEDLWAQLNATYNVRVELLDNWGNSYTYDQTGLQGVYAQNTATGQYIYPMQGDLSGELTNLPNGTYVIGSYDGYWDGAGTATITLSNQTVGADGYIVVTLSYWSE